MTPFALALLACLAPSPSPQACGQVESLDPQGGIAYDVSDDGEVVVGRISGPGAYAGFRWTRASGPVQLVFPGIANGVSADGSVVVGSMGPTFIAERAFRWSAATGFVDLGTLGGAQAFATDVSADGQVVVGMAMDGAGRRRAFRWTAAGGMQNLSGTWPGPMWAEAVSADGTTVVGHRSDASNHFRAFRWTAALGAHELEPPTPAGESIAFDVSADGSVVVGWHSPTFFGPPTAFRWTRAGGLEDLGRLAGTDTIAYAVSADGEIVVGASRVYPGTDSAFRWRRETGYVDLTRANPASFRPYACTPDAGVLVGLTAGAPGRLPLCWLGEAVCVPPVPNSTGVAAYVAATGSPVAATNQLELRAHGLPQQSAGFFLTSRQSAPSFPVSNSEGVLCLAGAIGRFVGPGQLQNSGTSGSFLLAVDLGALPSPAGPIAALAGETWNFQAWYRDANPTGTSNFTTAVGLTLR